MSSTRTISLTGQPIRIGRDAGSEVVLPDLTVSRQHAVVRADGGRGYLIQDLNSTAGSLVNGQRAASQVLVDGDEIGIGPYLLKYRSSAGTTEQFLDVPEFGREPTGFDSAVAAGGRRGGAVLPFVVLGAIALALGVTVLAIGWRMTGPPTARSSPFAAGSTPGASNPLIIVFEPTFTPEDAGMLPAPTAMPTEGGR